MLFLNRLVPVICIIGFFGASFIVMLIDIIARPLGGMPSARPIAGCLAGLTVLVVSWMIAKRLKPAPLGPMSKIAVCGHVLLALANLAVVVAALGPLAFAYAKNDDNYLMLWWFSIPVLAANAVLWPLGFALSVVPGKKPRYAE